MGRGPAHGGERVLDALREGVLRRQAIVDVEHHDACAIGQPDSMRLMAVDVANDEAAAVEEDERADRRPFGRGHAFDQDLSVRARSRKALELAGRQGRPGIEERADAARPLAADRPVAAGIEAGNAARLPFALQVGDRRIEGLLRACVRHRLVPPGMMVRVMRWAGRRRARCHVDRHRIDDPPNHRRPRHSERPGGY